MTRQRSAHDFYLEQVLPALIGRLDVVFPEFGWRRDPLGWVATNREFTRSRFGARPDRVVAHGAAPRGFLIHGGEATLWTTYLNHGVVPRGRQFGRVVRELASRAGVDARELERAEPGERKAKLLNDFFTVCCQELVSDRGANARDYLIDARGFPADRIEDAGIGLVPEQTRTRRELSRVDHVAADIERSGLLADSRWPGRLCGLWRGEHGQARTLWARAIGSAQAGEKYLYLRGGPQDGAAAVRLLRRPAPTDGSAPGPRGRGGRP